MDFSPVVADEDGENRSGHAVDPAGDQRSRPAGQERYLVGLSSLKPAEAAPLTDAALTPYRAISKALPFLEPDHYALVIWLGGLGQYGLKLLQLLSGCPIVVVDVSEQKLQLAREMGATHTLNGKEPDIVERIRDLTHGHGVSAAFDFVGTDGTLDLAIRSTLLWER